MRVLASLAWLALAGAGFGAETPQAADDKVGPVIDRVDRECRERGVPMIGRNKAVRLAEIVRQAKPKMVVECGTAIGYSGLWIARELKAQGGGKLITIEIDAKLAKEAEANFRAAGLADVIEVRVGDARKPGGGAAPGASLSTGGSCED